jgi:hypothetical protein
MADLLQDKFNVLDKRVKELEVQLSLARSEVVMYRRQLGDLFPIDITVLKVDSQELLEDIETLQDALSNTAKNMYIDAGNMVGLISGKHRKFRFSSQQAKIFNGIVIMEDL